MRLDYLEVNVDDVTYRVESIRLKIGLQATVTVYRDEVRGHSDRLNLDKANERTKFADAAGIDADDLLTVRETILDALSGTPDESTPADEPIPDELMQRATALLDSPDLLTEAIATITALGYQAPNGYDHLPRIVFLALTSRLLNRPLNLVVSGPSAAGKSYLVMTTARLFPADAIYALSGMSERVLAYTDANLVHRMLVIGEASALHRDGIGASLLRAIAWEGHLVYETVEKTSDGLKPRRIEKPGPTGFITTTTGAVEKELNTRVLEVSVPDTPAATRIILQATAERANGHVADDPDLSVWHAAQRWLEEHGTREVTIPYAEQLAKLVPDKLVRMRRDFTQILTLIQAHAVLCQRQRVIDAEGRIIATEADYRAVYDIAAGVFQAIAADGITPQVRETVAAVKTLMAGSDEPVGIARLSDHLKLDKSAVKRRVGRAISNGYLINDETRSRQPMKLRIGDALPEDVPAMPAPENVFDLLVRFSAPVHQSGGFAHADAENTGASTRHTPETVHQSVHQSNRDVDAENAGTGALVHWFTEGKEVIDPYECEVCGNPLQTPESRERKVCTPCWASLLDNEAEAGE
jgi:hypothetical protein